MKKLLMIGVCVSVMLCGCKSPEQGAYKTLGSIALTVKTAKDAYVEYRTYNKITPEQDKKIIAAYQKYQGAMAVAEELQKSLKTSTEEGKSNYEKLFLATQSVADEFISLIKQFIPQYHL